MRIVTGGSILIVWGVYARVVVVLGNMVANTYLPLKTEWHLYPRHFLRRIVLLRYKKKRRTRNDMINCPSLSGM